MAQYALSAGKTRKRALFGLLDADSWSWASVKAFLWFIVIIFMLGYLPDRAYYFTVFSTIDLGLLAWSPVNLCPAENRTLPCPAPVGATLPWQLSPSEISLPEARVDGAVVQAGSKVLYIGGLAGDTATDTVYVSTLVGSGNFDKWQPGPKLPAARSKAAVVFLGGSVYLLGGTDAQGQPTSSAYVLTPDPATGDLGQWKTAADVKLQLDLPAPRTGAAVVAAPDGLIVAGGSDANGPTKTVWKSTLDKNGVPGPWQPQADLVRPQSQAIGVYAGDYMWLYGGIDDHGATGAVQRGAVGKDAKTLNQVTEWAIANSINLPAARSDPAGFSANGALYLVGGSDGTSPKSELYWAVPDANGVIPAWQHLPQSDLPAGGLEGSAALVSGSDAIIIGGRTTGGLIASSARANLAPQPPFFQLGLFGATVPALKIGGEIGQQLGYLNAAGVGTVNFVLLLLVGWAIAHKERAKELWAKVRRRAS